MSVLEPTPFPTAFGVESGLATRHKTQPGLLTTLLIQLKSFRSIMPSVARTRGLAIVLLVAANMAASLSAEAVTILPGSLAATKSGDDLILSFPTTTPVLYTVQFSP